MKAFSEVDVVSLAWNPLAIVNRPCSFPTSWSASDKPVLASSKLVFCVSTLRISCFTVFFNFSFASLAFFKYGETPLKLSKGSSIESSAASEINCEAWEPDKSKFSSSMRKKSLFLFFRSHLRPFIIREKRTIRAWMQFQNAEFHRQFSNVNSRGCLYKNSPRDLKSVENDRA